MRPLFLQQVTKAHQFIVLVLVLYVFKTFCQFFQLQLDNSFMAKGLEVAGNGRNRDAFEVCLNIFMRKNMTTYRIYIKVNF